MWHEARKQEKKIRGMLVDYKRRAERRREYYEKIKLDPTQFIQLHGRSCKIHLDPSIHSAAEAPGSMMPWRGDGETMIDRFDVRAHLDDLPPVRMNTGNISADELWEERQCNYERFRILIQNEFLGVKEEKFLYQIHQEELFGPVGSKAVDEEKKLLAPKKAAIGFVYDDAPLPPSVSQSSHQDLSQKHLQLLDEDSDDESDSDIDLDLSVDVMALSNAQQRELNGYGLEFGLNDKDFMDLMSKDLEEVEALRVAKFHEDEKAMFSGRKSRKERRALKRKHLELRNSPPSYAARESPTYKPYRRLSSNSGSRSPSPPSAPSQIKFITTFGDESDGGKQESDAEGSSSRYSTKETSYVVSSSDSRKSSDNGKKCPASSPRKSHSKHSMTRNRDRSRSSSRHRHRGRDRRSSHGSPIRGSSSSKKDYSSSSRRHRQNSISHSRTRSPSPNRLKYRYDKRKLGPSRSKSRSKSPSYRNRNNLKKKDKSPFKNVSDSSSVQPLLTGDGSSVSLPSPPRKRYYGQRCEGSASFDEETSPDDDEKDSKSFSSFKSGNGLSYSSFSLTHAPQNAVSQFGKAKITTSSSTAAAASGSTTASTSYLGSSKLTPQERLKRKMQALLRKQYKADKKQQKERAYKAEQERLDREEELREMALKLRRRERERRHMLYRDGDSRSNSSSLSSSSRSNSRSPERKYSSNYNKDRDRESDDNRSKSHSVHENRHVLGNRTRRSPSREEGGSEQFHKDKEYSHDKPPPPIRSYRYSGSENDLSSRPYSDKFEDYYSERRRGFYDRDKERQNYDKSSYCERTERHQSTGSKERSRNIRLVDY